MDRLSESVSDVLVRSAQNDTEEFPFTVGCSWMQIVAEKIDAIIVSTVRL